MDPHCSMVLVTDRAQRRMHAGESCMDVSWGTPKGTPKRRKAKNRMAMDQVHTHGPKRRTPPRGAQAQGPNADPRGARARGSQTDPRGAHQRRILPRPQGRPKRRTQEARTEGHIQQAHTRKAPGQTPEAYTKPTESTSQDMPKSRTNKEACPPKQTRGAPRRHTPSKPNKQRRKPTEKGHLRAHPKRARRQA